jgi:hypothetical protein
MLDEEDAGGNKDGEANWWRRRQESEGEGLSPGTST